MLATPSKLLENFHVRLAEIVRGISVNHDKTKIWSAAEARWQENKIAGAAPAPLSTSRDQHTTSVSDARRQYLDRSAQAEALDHAQLMTPACQTAYSLNRRDSEVGRALLGLAAVSGSDLLQYWTELMWLEHIQNYLHGLLAMLRPFMCELGSSANSTKYRAL